MPTNSIKDEPSVINMEYTSVATRTGKGTLLPMPSILLREEGLRHPVISILHQVKGAGEGSK